MQRTMGQVASFLTTRRPGYYTLAVRAKPGARSSAFAAPVNLSDDAVEVRVAAPPVEGQANAELVDFLQSTLDTYTREMKAIKDDDAMATFFSGTAYHALREAGDAAKAAPEGHAPPSRSEKGGKGASRKSGRKSAAAGGGVSPQEAAEPLPEKLSISLSRGSTSRSKTLEVAFPGSEVELACLLQLAAQDAK